MFSHAHYLHKPDTSCGRRIDEFGSAKPLSYPFEIRCFTVKTPERADRAELAGVKRAGLSPGALLA
jgi:hypothetical protein